MECLKCGLALLSSTPSKGRFLFPYSVLPRPHSKLFRERHPAGSLQPAPQRKILSGLGCEAFSLTSRCGGKSWGFVSSNRLSSWEKASVVKAGHKTIGTDSDHEDPGTPGSLTQSLSRIPVCCGIPVSKLHALRTPILHKSGQCGCRKKPSVRVGALPPLICAPCYQQPRSESSPVLCCAAKWRTAKSPGRSPSLTVPGGSLAASPAEEAVGLPCPLR